MRGRWLAIAGTAALVAMGACAPGPSDAVVPYEELLVPEDLDEDDVVTDEQLTLEIDFLEVPRKLTLGSDLRYVVELRNEGDDAVELNPCPVYYQAWGESGFAVSRTSYLNCGDAPPLILPGDRLRFEMKLPMTDPEAVSVVGSIVWYLGSPGSPAGERTDVHVSGETDVVAPGP